MKTKTTGRKATKSAAAPASRFSVAVFAHSAEFFRVGEATPFSVLAYGAPGSDAHAKAERAISDLQTAHPGAVAVRRF
jgi:hypothetical protein